MLHCVVIQFVRDLPGVSVQEGRNDVSIGDSIKVYLALCIIPGMKCVCCIAGLGYPHRVGQDCIQGPFDDIRRKPCFRMESRDLAQGMHSCIGPSGGDELCIFSCYPPDLLLEYALNGRALRLDLPAVIISPIILDQQSDISHCGIVYQTSRCRGE